MAMDTALLESVAAGMAPVLRLYRWSPACLSFGRSQPARGRYDVAGAAARGIDLVRRPTGGQAVLHDDELTYAIIAPVAVIGRPRVAYSRINRALVGGLSRLGVAAGLAGGSVPPTRGGGGAPDADRAEGRARTPILATDGGRPGGDGEGAHGRDWDAACFRRPERGEVVVGGAKLVGSAQRVEHRTILQHGSILVGGTQALAESLLLEPAAVSADGPESGSRLSSPSSRRAPVGGWTTLERELTDRPTWAAIAGAVAAGFADVFGVPLDIAGLSESESEAVARLRSRYASDEWTWRR
ncbi:MAG: hypothetical protein R3314_02045 [Longimicrobiales bacterium]|nr:hypothetical protein [Longimicrobiales bacterium]